jgi:septum formation topological specificity factor MinE
MIDLFNTRKVKELEEELIALMCRLLETEQELLALKQKKEKTKQPGHAKIKLNVRKRSIGGKKYEICYIIPGDFFNSK